MRFDVNLKPLGKLYFLIKSPKDSVIHTRPGKEILNATRIS